MPDKQIAKSKLIPSVWEIPDYFHRRLGDRPGRQRAMFENGHLLLVLHEPPALGTKSRQARLFYRKPDGTWLTNVHGGGLAGLQKHLDDFEQAIEQIDAREDHARSADDYFSLVEQTLPLRRSASNLHATLDEARKQVPDARELINFRDQAYDIARSAELLSEAIDAGARMAQIRRAEEQSEHSRRMAQSAHRLNLLAAFFFPLATLATVFGMQLHSGLNHIPSPGPFVAVCAVGVAFGAVIFALVAMPGKSGR
ncbi:MAG TPA: CorA family divalent cation transporter [Pirellulaceae bacterium]|nr:CorA family divalent cation transporter [Pirellulaceae bacterium]